MWTCRTSRMLKTLRLLRLMTMAAAASLFSVGNVAAQDSKGTDFWIAFPVNYFDFEGFPLTLSLFITADTPTTGSVNIPGLPAPNSFPFTVAPGTVVTVDIPVGAQLSGDSEAMENKGIHVTAVDEVTVYGYSRRPFTTDAYLALPTDSLGMEYIALSYENNGSTLAIVATANATTVKIVPSATTATRSAGIEYTILLNQGQTYQLLNTAAADLSGTIITSDKPIAVFGSHRCANIPTAFGACDHVIEQLPPTSGWGTNFATMPLATRKNGDTFRFIASTNGTTVRVNDIALGTTLDRGQFHEKLITGPAHITSDKPILVAQYSNGQGFDGVTGDPFMMLIPSSNRFLSRYTVNVPATGFPINYINVVVPTAAVGSIELDNVAIPAASFVVIGSSGFSGAQISVGTGSHTLKPVTPVPFGAFVYGFAQTDSYGYPAGMLVADGDGDGIQDAADNCPVKHNPGQENRDGDAFGDVCDSCASSEGGASCEYSGTAEGPSVVQPGGVMLFTVKVKNNSSKDMLTIRPDCVNTVFTIKCGDKEVSPTIWEGMRGIPDGLITIPAGGEYAVTCDIGENHDAGLLSAAASTSIGGFCTVEGTYTNYTVDRTCDSLPAEFKNECVPDIWVGSIKAEPAITIKVEGTPVTRVGIDIVPFFFPNEWPCGPNWIIPVAVLSSEEFDASKIDPKKVTFGKTGVEALDPTRNKISAADRMKDVDEDGLPDMLFGFRFRDTGFSCKDIPAGLTSFTVDPILKGTAVVGGSDVPFTDSDALILKR